MTKLNIARAVGAFVLGATVSTAALAVTPTERQSDAKAVVVAFEDLNLESNVGAETLYRRINSAAEQVCGSPNERDTLNRRLSVTACIDATVEDAVLEIGHANLKAVHAS